MLRDQQTNSESKKTNSQKRLLGIFDFPPICEVFIAWRIYYTEILPKIQFFIQQVT